MVKGPLPTQTVWHTAGFQHLFQKKKKKQILTRVGESSLKSIMVKIRTKPNSAVRPLPTQCQNKYFIINLVNMNVYIFSMKISTAFEIEKKKSGKIKLVNAVMTKNRTKF